MYVRDIMTKDVITIPSDTSIADAKRIMKTHRFRRLPVLDKGKLKGLVTEHRLESVSPSKATSLSVWEVGYLLEKTKVKEIMERHLVTVPPDMEVEKALTLAQEAGVGCLIVVDKPKGNKLVGIVTTNDFFYKIANRVLGIGDPGKRIEIYKGGESKELEQIIHLINQLNLTLVTLFIISPSEDILEKDVIIHIKETAVSEFLEHLEKLGFKANIRNR